jgi:glycosyltransferase involved in cell wall biosynthesis
MRLIDAIVAAIIVLVAIPVLVLARLLVRRFGLSRHNVVVSLTADTIADTRRLNTPEGLARFYRRDPLLRTYVVHAGIEGTAVFRLGPGVAGVEVGFTWPGIVARRLPIVTRLAIELFGVATVIRQLRRVGGNVLEVMSPSAMVPRALIVQWLSGCRLTTQVRGNVDLLSHSLGAYFYCRIRSRWLIPQLFAGAIHTLIIEAFYRRCALVVGYNLNNLQSAISNGANPSRSRLARIAIDREILEAPVVSREALQDFPKSGRVILLWSRLGPEKYVGEALEAFIDLAATHSDVSLVTIGDGPTRASLELRARAAGLADRALFLGRRDHEFIRSAGACADVALVPYGGSSLVEAVLLDLPVVAFDVEWHAELIRNGETGFLADFPDPQHLASQLRTALDEPGEAQRMAQACRAVADRMFDPVRVYADERRFYETLLQHPAT